MINKVYSSADEAVADIPDGASIMFGGFGGVGVPYNLIQALLRKGTRNITGIANSAGIGRYPDHRVLVENRQIKRMIASFARNPFPDMPRSAFEEQHDAGEVELELVPQGTLTERIRAGGAGIAGFYTPTGIGTILERGKETKVFGGREHLLETALRADYALVRALRADRHGNLVYRRAMRNHNPVMATAADVTIAEVEEIVEVGELDIEAIGTPGIYVDRVVLGERHDEWYFG